MDKTDQNSPSKITANFIIKSIKFNKLSRLKPKSPEHKTKRSFAQLSLMLAGSICGLIGLTHCAQLGLIRTPANQNIEGNLNQQGTWIWAHRGASGELPEHTLGAYELAIEQGADAIEPDLVLTQDGKLIIRHENELSESTNVAAFFPNRKRTKLIDGKRITGWFSEDFTLNEIKKLKAKQRVPGRSKSFDSKWGVLTFDELLNFLHQKNQLRIKSGHTPIGLLPELKHPTYFRETGYWIEDIFLSALTQYGWLDKNPPSPHFWVQCFERATLQNLKQRVPHLKLLQLYDSPEVILPEERAKPKTTRWDQIRPTTYGDLLDPEELGKVQEYASGIGIPFSFLFKKDKNGDPRFDKPNDLLEVAHRQRLSVHVYTLKRENSVQSDPSKSNAFTQDYLTYFQLGVDAIFTDYPIDGTRARELQKIDTKN